MIITHRLTSFQTPDSFKKSLKMSSAAKTATTSTFSRRAPVAPSLPTIPTISSISTLSTLPSTYRTKLPPPSRGHTITHPVMPPKPTTERYKSVQASYQSKTKTETKNAVRTTEKKKRVNATQAPPQTRPPPPPPSPKKEERSKGDRARELSYRYTYRRKQVTIRR
ncbi:hypothetical protein L202_05568 [Cryptococcus amylolentus CBS 6039]|uniref:Uncharacterized protein n=1 Tax=Cryptococcus amylolentus CBS 6039 TaxID=1295533 RepID=A0A1E3HKZ7_9TREE|nr:hypothetical protein L202_05568 [Cryptococcus amylolentus CBS 6039]ODN77022.1 hypothetical protein L202_05568 [Cryptococcus amylolentus CBS 6039]